MKKIAFVNQRYGKEVNGGSEYYTMVMAGQLKQSFQVEVLTSKALTYDKWEDYYESDVEEIDGVTVRRFGIKKKRNRILQKLLKVIITKLRFNTLKITKLWNMVLGPYVPDLVEYLKQNYSTYDVFVFVTYMYYPTVEGMPEVADKAVFVPTAHDEYCIYFKVYDKIFHLPTKIIYLTPEEKSFVQERFSNQKVDNEVIGIGVSVPENVDSERFRKKFAVKEKYILYAGRVEADKGCKEMFQILQEYNRGHKSVKLIIIGNSYMRIPVDQNIKYLGFVTEEDKYDAMKGAEFLWLPSQFESLSIVVLESMALGVPAVVNGKCDVLKGHVDRSKVGNYYYDYDEFSEICEMFFANNTSKPNMAYRCREYVNENYTWSKVVGMWEKMIDAIK